MTTKEALEAIKREEKLDQSTIKRLYGEDYIEVSEVTNHQSHEREFLVTFITEKGRALLEDSE